jgi:hypothetical protein
VTATVGGDCGWLKHLVQAERETVRVEDAGRSRRQPGQERGVVCSLNAACMCCVSVVFACLCARDSQNYDKICGSQCENIVSTALECVLYTIVAQTWTKCLDPCGSMFLNAWIEGHILADIPCSSTVTLNTDKSSPEQWLDSDSIVRLSVLQRQLEVAREHELGLENKKPESLQAGKQKRPAGRQPRQKQCVCCSIDTCSTGSPDLSITGAGPGRAPALPRCPHKHASVHRVGGQAPPSVSAYVDTPPFRQATRGPVSS